MIKVISFCLWGNLPRYTIGAIKNAELALKYYSDFECWFYIHSLSTSTYIIDALKKMKNVKIILKNDTEIKSKRFMAWRFEPHDDPDVELFISRDTDTRILNKEVAAVREWLESDKVFHIMRDHPCHYPTILGGMFGCRKINGFNMLNEINNYFEKDNTKDDQEFLKDVVYPYIKNTCFIHDEIKMYEGIEECKKYPIKFDNKFHYIGGYVYEDESIDPWSTEVLMNYLNNNLSHRIQKLMSKINVFLLVCTKDELIPDTCDKLMNTLLSNLIACKDGLLYGYEFKIIFLSTIIPEWLPKLFKDNIILFNPIEDIPEDVQKQFIKYFYPSLISLSKVEDNKIILSSTLEILKDSKIILSFTLEILKDSNNIGDILKNIKKYSEDDFIIFNKFALIASENIWNSAYKCKSINSLCNNIIEWYDKNYNFYHVSYYLSESTHKLKINVIEDAKDINHIYVMHYSKLVDRRSSLEKKLKKAGLDNYPTTWVTQFDRENITQEMMKDYKYTPEVFPRPLTLPEIANYLAHHHIIEQALTHDITLILEDDIVFKDGFLGCVKESLEKIPKDWDIITLGGNCSDGPNDPYVNDFGEVKNLHLVVPGNKTSTVSCYLLSRKGAEKILRCDLTKPFYRPIDDAFCYILPKIDCKLYWLRPFLAYEGSKAGEFNTTLERGF